MQAPVLVDVDGRARRPWTTWFTDCATNAITGVAVTPVHPSRESALAALRSAVLREDPYGPFGGLPEKVRVDRGKDFLSRTVTAAFDLLDVTVEDLPAYTPHLKGAMCRFGVSGWVSVTACQFGLFSLVGRFVRARSLPWGGFCSGYSCHGSVHPTPLHCLENGTSELRAAGPLMT
ncbi:hypothetical protein ACFTZI_00425 [Streptomyces decoyicus]|uniref:hypothetical protein n=1 Tax=Streptomyces decoyicus TaxID=249567 RepID=UPI00363D7BCB